MGLFDFIADCAESRAVKKEQKALRKRIDTQNAVLNSKIQQSNDLMEILSLRGTASINNAVGQLNRKSKSRRGVKDASTIFDISRALTPKK